MILETTKIVLDALTLVVGVAGFGAVLVSLAHSRQVQRTSVGPYVRVDIGSMESIADVRLPPPYYEDATQSVDLATEADVEVIRVAAWFRNYQTSSLGFALGVRASFLAEIVGEPDAHRLDVEIPYLETNKCVKVALVTLPARTDARVMLSSLSFHDLFDKQHRHVYGHKSTNALHGRLLWLSNDAGTESTPEGRSRGAGIDYNIGGV